MKVKEIIESYYALKSLMGTKIKASTSLKLSGIRRKLKGIHDDFQEIRKKTIKDAGLEKHIGANGMLLINDSMDEKSLEKIRNKFGKVCEELDDLGEQESKLKLNQTINIKELTTVNKKEIDVDDGVFDVLHWLIK